MSDWQRVRIGDIAQIPQKQPIANPQAIELLRVRLYANGVERTGKYPRTTERGRPYFARSAGELLIGRQSFHNGGIGIVKEADNGLICSNAITSLVPNSRADRDYLFYILASPEFRKEIEKQIEGTAQAEISERKILSLELNLPPLSEQKKIAKILSGINLCISSTKRKLAKREIMLQSIIGRLFMMPQALGDVTGSHENDTPSVRRVPLREVCTVRQGLQIPISERSKTRGKGMLPYLTVAWINSNFSIEKAEYIDTPRSSVVLEEGEFVVARTGAVGRVFDGIRCVFHNNFFAVKCLPCINPNYLKHYLKSDALQNEMLERAGSTSIPDLNHGDFYSIEVPLHEPHNQKSIVAVIDSMESEICQIKKSIDTLQNLLIGVSSDLLSGRKRVSV